MKKADILTILASGLLLLGTSVGCSLCCAPYDYCGPVFANGQCSNLARCRCGTAFGQGCGQGGCATCGQANYGVAPQVTYDENGRPIQTVPSPAQGMRQNVQPQVQPQIQPSQIQPTRIQQGPAAQLQPSSGAALSQPTQNRSAQYPTNQYPPTQYRPASMNAQTPQRVAYAPPSSQQVLPPASPTTANVANVVNVANGTPQNGSIAVGADGYQKVEVYDENNQLMGYEIIDATGKSVSQLPAPSHVR